MPVPSPPAPTTLPSAPSFTLDKLLGSGHYGRVYRYEDQSTGEERAVKSVASSSGLADPQREAMALARVQEWAHPNVVRFFGHERITGGSLLVFECLHGGELFDHVIDMLSSGAPVPTERARFLFRQIVRGVAHLHALGIAHLDVKLENCMLGRDMETVTIVDLGLWHDLKEGFVTHTPYRGSPAYMSPEVFANMACGDRQPARLPYDGAPADVWSLGICLFVMVMGFYPLEERPTAQLYQHLTHEQARGVSALMATCGPGAASQYPHRAGYAPGRASRLNTHSADAAILLDQMLVAEPAGRASLDTILTSEFVGDSVAAAAAAPPPPPAPPPLPDELPPRKRKGEDSARDAGAEAYRGLGGASGAAASFSAPMEAEGYASSLASRAASALHAALRTVSSGPPIFHGHASVGDDYGGAAFAGSMSTESWREDDEDDEGEVRPSYRSLGEESGGGAAAPPPLARQLAVAV